MRFFAVFFFFSSRLHSHISTTTLLAVLNWNDVESHLYTQWTFSRIFRPSTRVCCWRLYENFEFSSETFHECFFFLLIKSKKLDDDDEKWNCWEMRRWRAKRWIFLKTWKLRVLWTFSSVQMIWKKQKKRKLFSFQDAFLNFSILLWILQNHRIETLKKNIIFH